MKTEGTFEYDSLVAGAEPVKVMTFPVASGTDKADLQRGLLLSWESESGLTPLVVGTNDPFAVLAEDLTEVSEETEIKSAPVYVGGAFNKKAVILKSGDELADDTVVAYAKIGIRLIDVAE